MIVCHNGIYHGNIHLSMQILKIYYLTYICACISTISATFEILSVTMFVSDNATAVIAIVCAKQAVKFHLNRQIGTDVIGLANYLL